MKLHRQGAKTLNPIATLQANKEPTSTLVSIIAYLNLSFLNSENEMILMIAYLEENC